MPTSDFQASWSGYTDRYVGPPGLSGEDMPTICAGNGVNAYNSTGGITSIYLGAYASGNLFQTLSRGGLYFDTSSLSGKTVTAATLTLQSVGSVYNGLSLPDLKIYICGMTSPPTSEVTGTASDYQKAASTPFGSAAFNTGGAKAISFNASGIAYINTSGYTNLVARLACDIAATFDGVWVSGELSQVLYYDSQDVTPSNRPVLSVTYTDASMPGPGLLMGSAGL